MPRVCEVGQFFQSIWVSECQVHSRWNLGHHTPNPSAMVQRNRISLVSEIPVFKTLVWPVLCPTLGNNCKYIFFHLDVLFGIIMFLQEQLIIIIIIIMTDAKQDKKSLAPDFKEKCLQQQLESDQCQFSVRV